jgi:hypothetical protein
LEAGHVSNVSWRIVLPFVFAPALSGWANTGASTNPVDASHMSRPVSLGNSGLVQWGDKPEYAILSFDDSQWLPEGSASIPHYSREQNVLWWRIHVKIDSQERKLALEAHDLSSAYEVYIDGQRIGGLGSVDPYRRQSPATKLIYPIPESSVHAGIALIAFRIRLTQSEQLTQPLITSDSVVIGIEETLQQLKQLGWLRANGFMLLITFLSTLTGFAALTLFLAERTRTEYLLVFTEGILSAIVWASQSLSDAPSVSAVWGIWLLVLGGYLFDTVFLLLCEGLCCQRFPRLFRLAWFIAIALTYSTQLPGAFGLIPSSVAGIAEVPGLVLWFVILPFFLIKYARSGNREAGLLLIPMAFWCFSIYLSVAFALLSVIPRIRNASTAISSWTSSMQVAGFHFDTFSMGLFGFWASLAVIMLLRSVHTIRSQTALHADLLAAREVQRVLVSGQSPVVNGMESRKLCTNLHSRSAGTSSRLFQTGQRASSS